MQQQRTLRLGVSVALLLCAWPLAAVAQQRDTSGVQRPAQRRDLLDMAEADQAVRQALIEKGMSNADSLDVARQDSVDAANQARLRDIIQRHGWPTRAAVGRKGVGAAFTIVQHGDLAFQKKMLPRVRDAFEQGEVPAQALALLTDRVLRKEGKLQRYGTQIEMKGDHWMLEPTENEAEVDERRRTMGLPPLSEYLKMVEKKYGMKVVRQ